MGNAQKKNKRPAAAPAAAGGKLSTRPAAAAGAAAEDQQHVEVLMKKGPISDYYDVDLNTVLGRGHYATVNVGVDRKSSLQVAVKRIQISKSRVEALKREVEVLRKVGRHPNIVTLYDIFITDTELILVLELLLGGELFDRMVEKGPYSEREASHHIRKIGLALKFLHRSGIVHRDLKPENLILTHKGDNAELKIADFGLANVVDNTENAVMKTVCGTWAYCAPEVKTSMTEEGGPACYTAKVDLWSVGVILYVILAAYHPFDADGDCSDAQLWANICSGKFDFEDPAWAQISSGAKDLIRNLIVVDPEKRFGTDELLAHPWVRQAASVPATPITPNINRSLIDYNDRRKSRKSWVGKVSKSFKLNGGGHTQEQQQPAQTTGSAGSRNSGSFKEQSNLEVETQQITDADVEEQRRILKEHSRAELKSRIGPQHQQQQQLLRQQHELEQQQLLHRVQQMVIQKQQLQQPFELREYEQLHAQQLALLKEQQHAQQQTLLRQQYDEFERAFEELQQRQALQQQQRMTMTQAPPRAPAQAAGQPLLQAAVAPPRIDLAAPHARLPSAGNTKSENDMEDDEAPALPALTLNTLLPLHAKAMAQDGV
jgi:calcium/calmodulin-dependent protein kinase-4